MPSVAVKLYSVFFKFLLKHRLQSRIQAIDAQNNPSVPKDPSKTNQGRPFAVTSRPDEETLAAANPSFSDGVATKDIHIDPLTSLSLRIFLPDSSLSPSDTPPNADRRRSVDPNRPSSTVASDRMRRHSLNGGEYRGYLPTAEQTGRRLPVILQFHGGGFVSGSGDSVANDFFCRRIAKLCDVVVIAVGYRLAPENKYPAAFDDGLRALYWLAKQSNLAECSRSMGGGGGGIGGEVRRSDAHRHIANSFGATVVEPWIAAHADPSRCVLLGVSCGANIADYVARKAVEAGKRLDPVKVVAQVLMYPFFIGSVPTHSEIKLANSYFYDKSMCTLAWKLFLPEEEFSLDHPAANPLIPGRSPPLKQMPPTLTVVAEHDWMRDRAIAYSEELRKVNVDAPVLEYKDAVHEFATLDMLLKTPQAQACADDIAIWVKKYISLRGHEFSY
ncbi:putative carboxylesterase 11 [Acorus calamus]|uniref:Carboxylesterase 11 n=1 Tax=Acorus calamus TaxID=4465 RepID=A0AAV9CY06_ACOCL|nr:putative carboxylesterase 11 [Acorus calamus]